MTSSIAPLSSQPSIDLSVVVCCHNSASRLPATLNALQAQETPGRIWEVLIVDNCSSDGSAAVAQQQWTRADVQLWVVRATPAGQSYAREAGIRSSLGRYILFCDDDNRLSPSYLETAIRILASDTSIAALGGHGIPDCEVPPPPWLAREEKVYATGPQAAVDNAMVEMLYGAGLVVRRSALDEVRRTQIDLALTGRVGQKLTSGDDTELCYLLRLVGHKLNYNSALVFHHQIPPRRLTLEYLESLYSGFGRGRPLLGLYRAALYMQTSRSDLTEFSIYILACAARDVAVGLWNGLLVSLQPRRVERAYRHMLRGAMIAQLRLLWNPAERRRYLNLLIQLSRYCASRQGQIPVRHASPADTCVTR